MKTKFLALGFAAGVASAMLVTAQADDRPGLPDAVRAAITRAYPQATIGKAKREKLSVRVWEVKLTEAGKSLEVVVAPDGTIVEEERAVERGALPAPVGQALDRATGQGATITRITRSERRARAALATLAEPRATFEAEWTKDGHAHGVAVRADGSPADDDGDDDDDDDDDDDGDD